MGPFLWEFTITSATHTYTQQTASHSGNTWWQCLADGTVKAERTTTWMGFTSGAYQVVQGETDTVHSQIGKISPSKLLFSSMQRRVSGAWGTLDITLGGAPPFPYGKDEPASGQFRNWTTSPH